MSDDPTRPTADEPDPGPDSAAAAATTVVIDDIDDLDPEGVIEPDPPRPPRPSRTWGRKGSGDDTGTERFFGVSPLRATLEASSVAAVCLAWVTIEYKLWDATAKVPLYQDRSDARQIANIVQNIITRGWFESNPHLGAPYGQTFYDFPQGGETFQLTVVKFLSLFIHQYGLLMNVYYIGGFAVTGIVTHLVLRHLRFSYPVAAIGSVLYVFLPFHFFHEESHMFRSSYFYAPVACLVIVWAMQWRERFLIDPNAPPHGTALSTLKWTVGHNLRRRRVIFMIITLVWLGSTETMTTCFTLTLLAVVGIIGALRHREWSRLLVTGCMLGVLGFTFLAVQYPSLHYSHVYGTNELAARRQTIEQELYGLKISRMVLPSTDHRWSLARKISNKAQDGSPVLSEGGQALTTLGTVGFISGLFWLVARGWGRLEDDDDGVDKAKRRDNRSPFNRLALLDNGALIILASTLIGTIAGFAMILSVLGFSQVRVWDRIVLLIAFFSFVFTGHWFEKLARWIGGKVTKPVPVIVVLALVVGAFGLWDAGRPAGRDYKAMTADFNSDHTFVQRIEQTVPKGTNVFELPVIPFPESPPPGKMLDYDELRPFLQSNGTTNWSYGIIKGRPQADWQWMKVRDHYGPITTLPALLGMGFTGIYVDTFGYSDGGKAIRAQLTKALGVQPMVSPNRRELYFDMRPYEQKLGMSKHQLQTIAQSMLGVLPPN